MEQPSSSTKESEMWNVILGCNLQNNRIISVPFQGKPFNIPVIQVYAPATDVKEAEAGLGVQNEAGQRLAEFCQEKTLVIANTLFQQQGTTLHMDIARWSYRIQIDYILGSWRWRSSIQSAKTRQWAEYGWDHELLIVKLRPNLKKVGKTTRSFRYDLNQTPYDYTVEMTNRFKGLDLIE